jgi:hypothetical protein
LGGDSSYSNGTTAQGTSHPRGAERRKLFSRKDDIDFILKNERALIARSVSNYTFKDKVHLKDLLMETGGKPIRALVATTW